MKLPRVPAPVWMCLPVLLLLALSLVLMAAPASAQTQAKSGADSGCAAPLVVAVVIDDGSRPLDPRDPYYAEKLAARYQALARR